MQGEFFGIIMVDMHASVKRLVQYSYEGVSERMGLVFVDGGGEG